MAFRKLVNLIAFLAFPLLLLLVIGVACGGDDEPEAPTGAVFGGTAVGLNTCYVVKWDPHQEGTLCGLAVGFGPQYNQVVEYNPLDPTEIIGDLAKEWSASDDGLTFTFTLHDDIKWTDGEDLTADDVAFSLNRMVEPDQPRPRVGLLKPSMKSAEADGSKTVKVNLHFPSPAFLPFLAVDYMKILPKHLLDKGVDLNVFDNIVGSGPFKATSTLAGDSTDFEKNPDYFKANRPFFDGLKMQVIKGSATVRAAFETGKAHFSTSVYNLSIDDALAMKNDSSLQDKVNIFFGPGGVNNRHVIFNFKKDPWTDLSVVKALRLATDHNEFIQAFGGGEHRAGAPFPVGTWYGKTHEELAKFPGYGSMSGATRTKADDIAEAKALLKAAGFDPPSALGKYTIMTFNGDDFPDLAQLWVEQMRRNLGLEIEVQPVDGPTGVGAATAGDYDILGWGFGYNITDPDDFVNSIYGTSGRNWSHWTDDGFQAMFDKQSQEFDRTARKQILTEMEEFLLTADNPYIETLWKRAYYAASTRIRTEAGNYVPAHTNQTVLKQEHMWLEE
jgi:peptide/nickel transport system substrate-binding protein